MKYITSAAVLTTTFILLIGLSCTPRGNNLPPSSPAPGTIPETQALVLTNPQDWTPPVFPGAVLDEEIQANMTAVAATPEALDETACDCFGFPVEHAIFYAYRSEADVQTVMDFYAGQMAAQGWKRIAIQPANSSLPHQAWQQGSSGLLVAYLMAATMDDNRTLIYLTVAKCNAPRPVIEE
jgi:hypothetical protein